jgi:hypothetical protein
MPRYKANVDLWISHENRKVNAGDEFETTFPKVINDKGKEVEMKLGSNIELIEDSKKAD